MQGSCEKERETLAASRARKAIRHCREGTGQGAGVVLRGRQAVVGWGQLGGLCRGLLVGISS